MDIKKASVIGLIGSLIMFIYQYIAFTSYVAYYSITSNLVSSIKMFIPGTLILFFLAQVVNQKDYKLNKKAITLICTTPLIAEVILDIYLLVCYHINVIYIVSELIDIMFSVSILVFLYAFFKSLVGKKSNRLSLKISIYVGLLGCSLNFIFIIFTEIYNIITTNNFINSTVFQPLVEQLAYQKEIDLKAIRLFDGWNAFFVYYKNDLIVTIIGGAFTICIFIYLYNLYKGDKVI